MVSYLKKNHFLISTCCLLAVLPIRQLVAPFIILTLVSWLISEPISQIFKNIRSRPPALLFLIPFLLYLIGMLYSSNQVFGWKDIEVKLSLFIFPIIYGGTSLNLAKHKFKFIGSYIISIVVISMLSIGSGIIQYGHLPTYSELNLFLHPGYLSLYLNLAIVLCFYLNYKRCLSKPFRALVWSFILLLSFTVWISLSKTGILIWALIIISIITYELIIKGRMILIPILLFILGIAYFSLQESSQLKGRFFSIKNVVLLENEKVDKSTTESTQVRLLIWEQTLAIIKENPIIGTGTGDIKDELFVKYEEAGMTGALENKLNVHNQILQIVATLGFLGFLLITLSFLFPVIKAYQCQNYIYLIFMVLIIGSFMFESMLERQDGVVFYAFFNSLLFFHFNPIDKKAGVS